jgi:hypothetical protein
VNETTVVVPRILLAMAIYCMLAWLIDWKRDDFVFILLFFLSIFLTFFFFSLSDNALFPLLIL